jgi:hypothetical protein
LQILDHTPRFYICMISAVWLLFPLSTLKSLGQVVAAESPGVTASQNLPAILQNLEANAEAYLRMIPSFYCDEHAIAGVVQDVHRKLTEADSTFELKRTADPSGKTVLNESREVKLINGHPSPGAGFSVQGMPQGVFSGSLPLVSLRQQSCMHYSLLPVSPEHPDSYTIRFTSPAAKPLRAECGLPEEATGRVTIDRASLEITRVEFTAPNHPIEWFGNQPVVSGNWRVFVDYAPVQLEGKTFWLPSRIISEETDGISTWKFDGYYRNYHKLEVTSRVIPPTPR